MVDSLLSLFSRPSITKYLIVKLNPLNGLTSFNQVARYLLASGCVLFMFLDSVSEQNVPH